jgi:hypothetical protein
VAAPDAFEKIRQAGRAMPAVQIRQLEALTKIVGVLNPAIDSNRHPNRPRSESSQA